MASKSNSISLDLRLLLLVLILLNVFTLLMWSPWSENEKSDKRQISVTGSSVIDGEPDEFSFSPRYEVTAASESEVNEQVADKSTEINDALLQIGLEQKQIEINANNFDYYWFDESEDQHRGSLYIQISAKDKDQAEKVQQYLVSSDATGQLTARPDFSREALKELESRARTAAIEDAKSAAERTASELDTDLGRVVSVTDADGYSDRFRYYDGDFATAEVRLEASDSASIPVTPGQQEFSFEVKVTFEID
ncbi:MAG: SIMPL domain-containing protein [Patescibacteria group bacterium]